MAKKPVRYTKANADKILKRLAMGETLNSICRDPKTPHKSTVIEWALGFHKGAQRDGFPDRYARARLVGYHGMGDEIVDIADDGTNDFMLKKQKNGEEILKPDNEAIQRSKLRVDTRKWLLAKVLPKIYGDRLQIETDNEKPEPLTINFDVADAKGPIKITTGNRKDGA